MKRALATFGTVAVLALSAVATGVTPAAAATPTCTNKATYLDTAGYGTRVPVDASRSNFCVLRQGATGGGVEALQTTLHYCYGATNLAVDGQFGPATAAALKNAQRIANVTADGVYGPNTRDALRWHWSRNWEHMRCLRLTSAPGPLR
ncbi:peptidoglycan-binding domain-containing protein [Streptomyces sp. JNUCC 64]